MLSKNLEAVVNKFTPTLLLASMLACQGSIAPSSQVNYALCKGTAYCKESKVRKIVDGDTLYVYSLRERIRLVLVRAPESNQKGGQEATQYLGELCPVGSEVLIDQDDKQLYDRYDRMVAVVWCLSERGSWEISNKRMIVDGYAELYKEFCRLSEFGNDEWAIRLGCPTK